MIRPVADRILFFVAATFNWLVAGAFVVAGYSIMDRLNIYPPHDVLLYQLLLLAVALFGAGYFWVGLDVTRNHAVVGLGAVGKVCMFAIFLKHALENTIPFTAVWVTSIDLVFAALFADFLRRARRTSRAAACQPENSGPQWRRSP